MFREVARKKQSLDRARIIEVLEGEKRGVLSVFGDNGYPYGMPINYYYDAESGYIYFHSGKKGHKIDAVNADNHVSFCVYDSGFVKDGEWALNISSVIVFGRLYPVEEPEKIVDICRKLSFKFTTDTEYVEREIEKFFKDTLCFELRPDHITGKIVNEA